MAFPLGEYINRRGSYVYSVMAVGHSAATGALVVDFKTGLVDGREFHLARLSKEHEPNLRKAGYSLYLLSWLRPLAAMAVAEMEVTMDDIPQPELLWIMSPCIASHCVYCPAPGSATFCACARGTTLSLSLCGAS